MTTPSSQTKSIVFYMLICSPSERTTQWTLSGTDYVTSSYKQVMLIVELHDGEKNRCLPLNEAAFQSNLYCWRHLLGMLVTELYTQNVCCPCSKNFVKTQNKTELRFSCFTTVLRLLWKPPISMYTIFYKFRTKIVNMHYYLFEIFVHD